MVILSASSLPLQCFKSLRSSSQSGPLEPDVKVNGSSVKTEWNGLPEPADASPGHFTGRQQSQRFESKIRTTCPNLETKAEPWERLQEREAEEVPPKRGSPEVTEGRGSPTRIQSSSAHDAGRP